MHEFPMAGFWNERMSQGIDVPPISLLCERTVTAVRAVGRQIARRLMAERHRKADGSFLTEVDLEAQAALTLALQDVIDCPVLGEEMEGDEQLRLWLRHADGLWCIDPIDGTTNFANGIPFYGLSVAYMVDGKTRFGVVYNPALDEAFYAEQGCGAWLNGVRLPLREASSTLQDCVAGVDFKRIPKTLGVALALHPPYHSQRSLGSSALEWCYVAAGRLDINLHGGQMLWDYAAGRCILAEAGGAMSTLEHDDFDEGDIWRRAVITAASPFLLGEWREWIREHCLPPGGSSRG